MKSKLTVFVVCISAVIFVALIAPAFAPASNCGGNSAALSTCSACAMLIKLASDDQWGAFDIRDLSIDEKSEVVKFSRCHWIPEARFLVRTNIDLSTASKQILIVCDQPYSNVPQPTLLNAYKKTPAHAVAYSDGSVGLITPAQFKELNLSEFIDLAALNTNAVLTADKGALP